MYILSNMFFIGGTLRITLTGTSDINSLVLRYRSKISEDDCEYEFELKQLKFNKWVATLPVAAVDLKVIYWDLVVKNNKGEEGVSVGKWRNILRNPFYNGRYRDRASGMFIHPYITPDLELAFQFREYSFYDGLLYRISEMITLLIYYICKPFLEKKNIILIYEKFCQMASDNGFYFFRYIMDNNMEEKLNANVYYVINPDAKDMQNLYPYRKNVVGFLSLKHKLYMLAAKKLVSTDTRKHVYVWRMRMSLISHLVRKKPLIFLQHGVLGLKRVESIYGKGNIGDCNLFITSSDYEKELVIKNFGYKRDEIKVTGLARWDVLSDKSESIIPGGVDYNMILVMPTWRNWLEEVDDETFMQSEYYIRYSNILKSERLLDLLENQNLQMCFYIHPKFKDYIKDFETSSRRIRIVEFGDEPLNELIMRCKLLITDYSSVAWDVFYQNKPVLFYHFDLDKYIESQGSYIDMNTELFGDKVFDDEELYAYVCAYADGGFELPEKYKDMHNKYFKYTDNNNCERIAEYLQMVP